MRLSTSAVERPGASVWISTSGGANSGKTSSGVVRMTRTPTIISATASATMMTRIWREVETIQFICQVSGVRCQVPGFRFQVSGSTPETRHLTPDTSFARAEFRAEEFGDAGGDDLRADGRAAREHGERTDDAPHLDAAAGVLLRRDVLINPCAAVDVVSHRRPGHDQTLFRRALGQRHAHLLSRTHRAVAVRQLEVEVGGVIRRVCRGRRVDWAPRA